MRHDHPIFPILGTTSRSRFHKPAILIDPSRDSSVGSDQQGKPIFDCSKDSAQQVQVENGRAPKPAIVGNGDKCIWMVPCRPQVLYLASD
jgi:hypothetical protein